MSIADIVKSCPIQRTARVLQLEGLFDIPPSQKTELRWSLNLPIHERSWNIGLIVGPSGAGKSTILTEIFGRPSRYYWPEDQSIVDGFPAEMGIKEITGLLSSVGFSSPPAWLRPFHLLSTGEQFRANVARALSESDNPIVIDEFTSVVDRIVAQIGSAAVAKAVRRREQQLVVASCHYDITEWLQPDWIYQPHVNEFQWRSLQRRPCIRLDISRVHRSTWRLFSQHHYLDTHLNKSAACYVAFINNETACAFTAVLSFPHPRRPGWREHRTVCLPDYQGVGIGNALSEYVAGLYKGTGKPYFSTTSNPAMIYHRAKSSVWDMRRSPQTTSRHRGLGHAMKAASSRITAGFEYTGAAQEEDAKRFRLSL